MCSIAGYLRWTRETDDTRQLRQMNRALAHRGPDDSGLFIAEGAPRGRTTELRGGEQGWPHRVGLAHNRFSILDPSPAGHQPFASPDGRYTLVFNGEIYNFAELREEFEEAGWHFRSQCDTEVLLAGYAILGPECFRRFNGFWALALWDNHTGSLLLSRDRFGEAPLFLARHAGAIYFASEIPALLPAIGNSAFGVSAQAVSDYLHHGLSDIAQNTFYESITQLPPATYAHLRADGSMEIHPYWKLPAARATERQWSSKDAVDELRKTLAAAVRIRLRADVPVGFQLSGGMDSSTLVALAASQGQRLTAFTVSYPGTPHDEFPYAASVAERYKGLVDHHELRDPGDEFWSHADDVVARYAEPFSGPNTFTQQLVWREMRRQGIKVVINGGAGDELFAGYRRDFHSVYLRELLRSGHFAQALTESALLSEDPAGKLSRKNFSRLLTALKSNRYAAPAGMTALSSPGSAIHYLDTALLPTTDLPDPRLEPSTTLDARLRNVLGDWRLAYYVKNGNIASLSVPVELRFPFLDHNVAELAHRLPHGYLIRDGWMKWALRKVAEPLLPADVVWRKKKMGFPFPYVEWCKRSKGTFLTAVGDSRVPYLSWDKLVMNYDQLAERNPIFLWRCMSLSMWWRRCVEGKPLQIASRTALAA